MTIDLDTLKRLAKAATQGRWDYSGHEVFLKSIDSWPVVANCRNKSNAAYIAAVNPQVVLKLIAEIRKLRAELKYVSNLHAEASAALRSKEIEAMLADNELMEFMQKQ